MSTTTGPGRPVVAIWNASCSTRARSFTSFTSQLCLVQGRVMPTVSHSWNASLPIRCVGTWPVMHTSGMESISASVSGVTGALLVPHQDVLDLVLLENLVIDRKHRAARIAEDVFDAVIDQGAHDHGCAGHLVRIVVLVAHGWLRMRLGCAASSVEVLENKKGPKRPHAHRPNLDGLSHPRRCAWVRRR